MAEQIPVGSVWRKTHTRSEWKVTAHHPSGTVTLKCIRGWAPDQVFHADFVIGAYERISAC